MDAMRKQLDVLMGANRNGDVEEVSRNYYDRDVCRLFLAGLCPHDLFQLTKMDLGPCSKIHSLQLRKDYEEAKSKGKENFDRELEDVIERLIVECDRKIQRALKRLADEDAKAAIAISVSEVTQNDEILQLSKEIKQKMKEVDTFEFEGKTDDRIKTQEALEELRTKRADMQATLLLDAFNKDRASIPQPAPAPQVAVVPPPAPPDARTQEMINEKLKKAEELGEQGLVDEAQRALEEAEALKKLAPRQEPASDSSKYTANDVRITDQNDRRLADHFGGKLHLGYLLIREKLKELQCNVPFSALKSYSVLGLLASSMMRGIEKGKTDLKMIDDLGNLARTATAGHQGIKTQTEGKELSLEKVEIMIGIVIDVTIGTVAMTVIGIEIMTVPEAMIQGEGIVLVPGSAERHDRY
ncbi:hypothetical protein ACP4OV_001690 [Aristida adscensionis]